jgi:uncharacterized protein (TIGR02001 family)
MKTYKSLVRTIAICVVLVALGAAAQAQDAMTTKLDAAYVSKYVWRGIPQTQDGAFQPSLTFSGSNGLSFNFWASQDSNKDEFTENDYTLNYAWSAGKTAWNAGYIYYAFPNTSYVSTSELYASAGFSGPLAPVVSINYDVDEADGFYLALSGSHSLPVGKSTVLSLSGRIGLSSADYNKFWFGVDSTALSDLYLSASVPFTVGKMTLTPSLGYTTLLSSKLKDGPSMSGLKSDNFIAGLTVSVGF